MTAMGVRRDKAALSTLPEPEKARGPWSDRFTSTSRHSLSAHQPSAVRQEEPFKMPKLNDRIGW
jgi:hypothetical protein